MKVDSVYPDGDIICFHSKEASALNKVIYNWEDFYTSIFTLVA